MRRPSLPVAAAVAATGLALVVALLAALLLPRAPGPTAAPAPLPTPGPGAASATTPGPTPPPRPLPAGPVLPSLAAAPPAEPAAVRALLQPLLDDPSLGSSVGAAVLDVRTGAVLLEEEADVPQVPASVAKLRTGEAALAHLGPEARLLTRVRAGDAPGEVVLVGGGDPTLTVAPAPRAVDGHLAPSLTALAADTAERLRATAPTQVVVRVDGSAFTGPAVSPDWAQGYPAAGVVSPVHALTVDTARVGADGPGTPADPDPALAAGRAFAALLRAQGLPVAEDVERVAPSSAPPAPSSASPSPPSAPPAPPRVLAQVESPPVRVIVERMLRDSDNDAAEALARLAAAAAGHEPSFAGVAALLGDEENGVRQLDGSGLARVSSLPPRVLGDLLVRAAGSERDELAPLLTGLPVAGFTGTLARRFAGDSAGAAGDVRAKTGTLTGVSSLAGTVVDADGRLLAFAVLADEVGDTRAARATLDEVAAALAGCGC